MEECLMEIKKNVLIVLGKRNIYLTYKNIT